jgi:mevalonate kinase
MSGFGSSAALAVALLRAKAALTKTRPADRRLLVDAIRVEDVAHGKASGVDPAIALFARPILFARPPKGRPRIQKVRFASPIHMIAATTGGHGGTRGSVGGIAAFRAHAPKLVEAAMAALGEMTRSGTRALVGGDLSLAGRTMDLAHGLLSGFGIVSVEVDEAVRRARRLGALGAKMSGAGGHGGALIALARSAADARRIARSLTRAGVTAWPEAFR